jgi:outer membrane protein assembly factor BamB
LSHEGKLFCLNVKNGKLRWEKDLVTDYGAVRPYWGFAGSPVVEGELLILTANTSGIALNRNTGQMVWGSEKPPKKVSALNSETTGVDYSTPFLYDHEGKRYALITSWKGVFSVDVHTGKPLWLDEWDSYTGTQIPGPVMTGNKVFVDESITSKKSTASRLFEITDKGPTVLWRSPDLYTEITTPVIVDGYIYGCQGGPYTGAAALRCIDLETGRLMWDKSLPDETSWQKSVTLMAANGKLITPTGYTEISGCDVYNGKEKQRKFWTPPVLCNGRIYCRNWYGDLVCIDVSK